MAPKKDNNKNLRTSALLLHTTLFVAVKTSLMSKQFYAPSARTLCDRSKFRTHLPLPERYAQTGQTGRYPL